METPAVPDLDSSDFSQSSEDESLAITSRVDELSQEAVSDDSETIELKPVKQDISRSLRVLLKVVGFLQLHEIIVRIMPLSQGVHAYFKK